MTLIATLILEKRSWCRYLCPFGSLLSNLSFMSSIAVRANRNVCTHKCNSPDCFIGKDGIEGCPMLIPGFAMESSGKCVLCTKCFKTCSNHSIRLNLRAPWSEIVAKPVKSLKFEDYTTSLFLILLSSTVWTEILISRNALQQVFPFSYFPLQVLTSILLLSFISAGSIALICKLAFKSHIEKYFYFLTLAGLPAIFSVLVSVKLDSLRLAVITLFERSLTYDLQALALSLQHFPFHWLQVAIVMVGVLVTIFLLANARNKVSAAVQE